MTRTTPKLAPPLQTSTPHQREDVWPLEGRVMVWRKPNQQMLTKNSCGTVLHGGGGVMVCMSATDVGNLRFIEGNVDKCMYRNILKQNVLNRAEKLSLGTTFTFQRDNDPKHASKICQEWCLYHVK
ncbi:hypothetical protein AVEN_83392-1 [Araneus ventricosus]|uniref:Transposable element Tcb1 transposase n=1 Tax=Araneus ventricosus TaxID=182803 RepID=A0A4Y2HJM0_ARAVE|nr:hypothetical protein AVEN_83392-1 [Araneus ventricosus]